MSLPSSLAAPKSRSDSRINTGTVPIGSVIAPPVALVSMVIFLRIVQSGFPPRLRGAGQAILATRPMSTTLRRFVVACFISLEFSPEAEGEERCVGLVCTPLSSGRPASKDPLRWLISLNPGAGTDAGQVHFGLLLGAADR